MTKISLTDFIDVVSRAGASKATKVATIKNRPKYSPASDFYKGLREQMVESLSAGYGKKHLDKVLVDAHPKKRGHFKEAISGFKKWWGRKKLVWFNPTKGLYGNSGITVSVNPELGIYINDTPYLIKLYFKADKLPKNHANISTHLMQECLSARAPKGTVMAVLDVKRGKLFEYDTPHSKLEAALKGELAYIEALWNSL